MLTADLVKPRLRTSGQLLTVKMLDARAESTAADLLALLNQHIGQTQGAWETALENYIGDRTDYVVVRGIAKCLSDAATFLPIASDIDPTEVRRRVFEVGPAFAEADLFAPFTRSDFMEEIAKDFGTTIEQIELLLYADRPAEYILTDPGQTWTPEQLIARYNLELTRAVLYWSDEMQVQIYDTFKDFWRYLKLFKLMFWGTPIKDGYHVLLDGPISPFVHSTTRYGRQFAAFLPALFLCEQWRMQATVKQFGGIYTYHLSHETPLTSHFKRSPAFDSRMESDFAAEFHAKFGDERGKWRLTREDEVLLLGDTVMIPDFALTYTPTGERLLIEIMGFWHPAYLRRKLAKVRAAGRDDLILLVYEGVNLGRETLDDIPAQVLYFKNKPVLKDVLALAESLVTTPE